MKVSYEGIGYLAVTVPDNGCAAGVLCKLDSNGAAEPCADGEKFVGLVEAVEGMQAAVQIHGFARVGYSGATPSIGYVKMLSNGAGGVRQDATGREHLVVEADRNNMTVVIKL